MKRNMVLTFIYLIALSLLTVHSKKEQIRMNSINGNKKNQIYDQLAINVLIHIFTKIGFSTDIVDIMGTLDKSCLNIKRRIVKKIRKNLVTISNLQKERIELFASTSMVKMIQYILNNLQDCKKLKKNNKEIFNMIKKGSTKARKLEKNLKFQLKFDEFNEKYISKGKKISKKEASKFFRKYSRKLPSDLKKKYNKAIQNVSFLSESCKYYKKQCEKKKKYCKKSDKTCKKLKDSINNTKKNVFFSKLEDENEKENLEMI